MLDDRTVILIPVLGRSDQVHAVYESIRSTSGCRVEFICSHGDSEGRAAVEQIVWTHPLTSRLIVQDADRGDYAGKINVAARTYASMVPVDRFFLGATDLIFHPGWLQAIDAVADGYGVIGTNDLGNRRTISGQHSTHSMVTVDYMRQGTIDEPNTILHEGYWHEYVDDELVATAKARGEFVHAADAHVEHMHPLWGKESSDASYDLRKERSRQGAKLFKERSYMWT